MDINTSDNLRRAISECKRAQELLGELPPAGFSNIVDDQDTTLRDRVDTGQEQDVHEAWACLQRARAYLQGGSNLGAVALRQLDVINTAIILIIMIFKGIN